MLPDYAFFDSPESRLTLLPLTFSCSPAEFRVGIFTIQEKWAFAFGAPAAGILTAPYLQLLYTAPQPVCLWLNSTWLPDPNAIKAIKRLKAGESIWKKDVLLALYLPKASVLEFGFFPENTNAIQADFEVYILNHPWDIFGLNGAQIRYDFENMLQKQGPATIADPHTITYNEENIWIHPSAKIKAAVLNAESGPIYIGPDTEIQEGSLIRGPFALCQGSTVNMGAKIRGDSTIGPYAKVGGEISNSIIMGYSNKGHDGFLGNSVIGKWCNLGADTNTSNLKNTYGNVKAYSYANQDFLNTNTQFCGLIMADHCKAGINTMFNTGTVVGLGSSVWGGGFLPKHIPSFSWGGPNDDFQAYNFEQFLVTESRVMARRNIVMSPEYKSVLAYLYEKQFGHKTLE